MKLEKLIQTKLIKLLIILLVFTNYSCSPPSGNDCFISLDKELDYKVISNEYFYSLKEYRKDSSLNVKDFYKDQICFRLEISSKADLLFFEDRSSFPTLHNIAFFDKDDKLVYSYDRVDLLKMRDDYIRTQKSKKNHLYNYDVLFLIEKNGIRMIEEDTIKEAE